jgi:c-di-GMP-binding flagellar brake protein YcgR
VPRVIDLLNKLDDQATTTVDLPGRNGEHYRCKAMLVKRNLPEIELVFPPNSWEKENLLFDDDCHIAIELDGHPFNLIAQLHHAVGDRRLHCTAREPVAPESLREYFRVAVNMPIEASYIAGPREVNNKTWKMIGTTIDLSGCGVLGVFAEKPASTHNIQLVMTHPEEEAALVCLADVVRTYRIRKNRYQVAFHFNVISPKTRDHVISLCLREQRRHLRDNVELM